MILCLRQVLYSAVSLQKYSKNLLTTDYLGSILLSVANGLKEVFCMIKKKHYAWYGNLKMVRMYCSACKGMTLVVDGIKQCCEEPAKGESAKQQEYITPCSEKRKKPSPKKQKEILEAQENKCFYCQKEFGTPYMRNNKVKFTKLHWDHLIPYSRARGNLRFVASCNICNLVKSNLVFDTIEEAINYVEYNRKKKGFVYYEDENLPSMQKEV